MSAQPSIEQREFFMSDKNFETVRDIAYRVTGINLTEHKRNMVYGRLARRIRFLGLNSFDQYCAILKANDKDEMPEFVNSITTNLTSFFRENHHFEFLQNTVFPQLIKANSKNRRVRIWSAGCSTGEEPYSISMCASESFPINSWDFKILATDLDSNVVAHGKAGIYAEDRVTGISAERRKSWFKRSATSESVKVKAELQQLITFKQLNLLEQWPMKGAFDVIFCRNVVIYFDKPTQKKLFERYANILPPNGYLFIGHSESLHNVCDRFEPLGRTIYKKKA